ncbi:MAG: ribokinase [Clostridia bacterium]
MKVINFGSLNLDHVYRVNSFVVAGETKASLDYRMQAGGKGLNQSIAMANAGLDVYHAGCIGSDDTLLNDTFSQYRIHTEYLQTLQDCATGHAIIQVDDAGENCILLYRGTNGMLTEEHVDYVLSCFGKDDLVVLQNETNLIPYIMRAAHRRGMRIAFNAAPYEPEIGSYPLDLVTWLFVNEQEGGCLSGEILPESITEKLHRMYPDACIVLTLGKDGCVCRAGSETFRQAAFRVKAVDTTAAGDTFVGYFLYGASAGLGVCEAQRIASAAGALAVTNRGAAMSIPTKDQVDCFLQQNAQ